MTACETGSVTCVELAADSLSLRFRATSASLEAFRARRGLRAVPELVQQSPTALEKKLFKFAKRCEAVGKIRLRDSKGKFLQERIQ